MQHLEIERTLTVQPLPEAVKAEGGLLLDTEGRDTQGSLRLASDGHVSVINIECTLTVLTHWKPDRTHSSTHR